MRIKRLELCGFKSFVDPTLLDFAPGISAIVGPNGCGKSNIVDALRWVLGEQSAKRLRGDAMEDIIFNGTEHGHGPAGMAEVSLLLENDAERPEEEVSEAFRALRDVPEILVTRRYFRSGESEYLINRRPCRLKDITELFLGTGVGTKAYAMIEQGRVDQLVNARPEDLRFFIEEAAGTTLYRDRRLAAERKMERTRENLSRVNDILQEIDRQIAFFRRMAKRAEQYRTMQTELRRVDLQIGKRSFDRLNAEIVAIEDARARCRERETELAAAIAGLDANRDAARSALAELDTELRDRQEKVFALRSARERAQARLEMLDREEVDSVERLARIEHDRSQLSERLEEIRLETARREEALRELGHERERRGAELTASLERAALEESEVVRLEEGLEKTRTDVVEILGREAELRNRLSGLEGQGEERRARRKVLLAEIVGIDEDAARVTAEGETLRGDQRRVEAAQGKGREELQRLQRILERVRVEKGELDRSYVAMAATLAESESRLVAAEEVERGYGRYHDGVQAVMRKHAEGPNGVLNLVAEVLEAPPEFEKAVAAVLGERLQYVIVRRPEDAREAILHLKASAAGRSSFVPVEPYLDDAASAGEAGSGRARRGEGLTELIDVVRVEEGYGALAESLLGDAVLVSDLESGISLWNQNGRPRTMVTLDGDVVYPSGVISGGSAAPYEEDILAQRREIRRLRHEVERLRPELAELEARRLATSGELEGAERRLTVLEESLHNLSIERVSLEKDAEKVADGLARGTSGAARARAELEALEGEIASLSHEADQAGAALAQAGRERRLGEEERRRLEAELANHRSRLDVRSRGATELKVELAQAGEKEERLQDARRQLEVQRNDLEERVAALGGESDALRLRAGTRADEARALRALVERTVEQERTEGETLDETRRRAEGLRLEVERTEGELEGSRAELDRMRGERSEHDVALAEKSLRRDHVVEGIRERYQVEVGEVSLEPGDEAELQARLAELQQKVDRIDRSQVGVEAAGELEEEERRREVLATQKADLEHSITDLQKTIASLNRASRDRFAETFASVNEKFQHTFPRMFGGGRARLVFTDQQNLLETGVDIEVQPPGMNLRTLSLLSGGQKALTAVSLIFSLFMCRPSPFCVLDEVDAPLDDANIDRFNDMVREMGGGSQFLIITHNKRTMEVAEALYGVTMQEPGVSKIVSVRFQRAA